MIKLKQYFKEEMVKLVLDKLRKMKGTGVTQK